MTSPADLWAAARAEVEWNLSFEQKPPARSDDQEWHLVVWRGYLGVLDRHRPQPLELIDGRPWCYVCRCSAPCPEVAAVLDSLRATGWQG